MTDEEILRQIAAIARDKLGSERHVGLETRLVEDLELDSIRLLTLAVELEDRFRIRLEEADEEALTTVADLVAVVGRKLAP